MVSGWGECFSGRGPSGFVGGDEAGKDDHVAGIAEFAAYPLATAGDQAQAGTAVIVIDAFGGDVVLTEPLDRVDLEDGHLSIPAGDLDPGAGLQLTQTGEDGGL